MTHLDSKYPTIIFNDFPLIDPIIIEQIMGNGDKKLNRSDYYYRDKKIDLITLFVRDIASGFLDMYDFNHYKDIWYMDCIQYKLDNEIKPVKSGLAWHCENDNYPNLITVLLYNKSTIIIIIIIVYFIRFIVCILLLYKYNDRSI